VIGCFRRISRKHKIVALVNVAYGHIGATLIVEGDTQSHQLAEPRSDRAGFLKGPSASDADSADRRSERSNSRIRLTRYSPPPFSNSVPERVRVIIAFPFVRFVSVVPAAAPRAIRWIASQ